MPHFRPPLALILALVLGPVPGLPAAAEEEAGPPSFDCATAQSGAEKAVCASPDLAALDRVLATLYGRVSAAASPPAMLAAEQRGWIKGRDDCWKEGDLDACVARAYVERISALVAEAPEARGDLPVVGPISVTCEGLDGLRAVFVNVAAGYVDLRWGENAVVLASAISASGARYAGTASGGAYEFWEKGPAATFTTPDMTEPSQCGLVEPAAAPGGGPRTETVPDAP